MNLPAAERAAVEALLAYVAAKFGLRLREIALFGSHARGEADEESDVDVLIVVDDLTSQEAGDVAGYCGHPILTNHDVIVSPFIVSTEHFATLRARERRIVDEIDRDRVDLIARRVA